ncbi:MAG: hypothetical protein BGO70_12075 [Bacteroidetes bacterium 43-93]|nr:TfoX/Sxy family protein [Bacteroidota bacterium]OJW98193.1 MAG: hypothetical protein BGO70_12075 [Bacteroidetes bacterium 43-93]
MPYSEKLADRIREALSVAKKLEEKKMFTGLCFMVNDKMCIAVHTDDIMVRIDPDRADELCAMPGVQPMVMKGKPLKGYVLVDAAVISKKSTLQFWTDHALKFNKKAKSSKKKK